MHLLGVRPCAPGDAEMPTQQVSALSEPPTEQGMGALGVRLREAAEKDSRRLEHPGWACPGPTLSLAPEVLSLYISGTVRALYLGWV